MREILFRGKTKTGIWIEGDLLNYIGFGKVHIAQNYKGAGGQEVIPETVGQYTGLTDKNGNKIFENDIVRDDNDGLVYIVRYAKHNIRCCGCCYTYHSTVGFYLKSDDKDIIADEHMWDDIYVIGNIHDNPELLKGGEG